MEIIVIYHISFFLFSFERGDFINYYTSYNDHARKYHQLLLNINQWSGLSRTTLKSWISNFEFSSEEEEYYVMRLLSHLLYYSETDLENLLSDGVNKIVNEHIILDKQLKNHFSNSIQDLNYYYNDALKNIMFVPLLNSDGPYESANVISRLLVTKLDIPTTQTKFTSSITDNDAKIFKYLVILDDNVGSGDQFEDYWGLQQVSNKVRIEEWCSNHNIQVFYLSLIGYKNSLLGLAKAYPEITFICSQIIDDSYRVFERDSYIWRNLDERNHAKKFFLDICNNYEIAPYGHAYLDFLLIMHQTIPDWTIPLLWKSKNDWKILMKRKNSYE